MPAAIMRTKNPTIKDKIPAIKIQINATIIAIIKSKQSQNEKLKCSLKQIIYTQNSSKSITLLCYTI